MHLVIPFAAAGPDDEAALQAQRSLDLPVLRTLLARLLPVPPENDLRGDVRADLRADPRSWSAPHERVLARALGWTGADGALPFAAWQAAADGVDVGDLAWGLLSPAHWHLGTEQVSLIDPAALMLDEAASRALFDAVLPLFTEDGWQLHWAAPLRWYAAHESLTGLRSASLDRVVGRNVDAWLGSDPAARHVRRLQAEVQMLLHTHPLNAAREARSLLPVNSFWLSGCGVAQPVTGALPTMDTRLRSPALAADWAAWVKAWDTLDAGPLAQALAQVQRGAPLRLTLCGEREAADFLSADGGVLQRLRSWWRRPDPQAVLEAL